MKPPPTDLEALVDYAKSLDCIHCGLCLDTCPTYRLSGVETSSPRGRIHLMRAVGEGRLEPDADYAAELEFCLLCRHCESVCPAGVRFGRMMETARGALRARERPSPLRRLALGWLLPRRLALRLAGSALRLGQLLRLDGPAARLLGADPAAVRALPRVPPLRARALLPERVEAWPDPPPVPAGVERPSAVAVLEGCVQPELLARVNRATVRSLAALGIASRVPPGLVCCGSLHAHGGDLAGARRLARRAVESLEALRAPGGALPLLVTNSAGCGSHLRELAELFAPDDPWHARAAAVAGRVRDYSELVAPLLAGDPPPLPAGLLPEPFAWDDPCHLCHGQGIRAEPRRVLDAVVGGRRVELSDSESCCGSAGVYALLRPADAERVFAEKLAAFDASGARTLVTANPGCQIQWEGGLRRAGRDARVVHLAELVEAALAARRAGS